jgi:hypothetical protein
MVSAALDMVTDELHVSCQFIAFYSAEVDRSFR